MRPALLILTTSLFTLAASTVTRPQRPDPSFPQPDSGLVTDELGFGLGKNNGMMTLADALTLERRAGVWWDYARDISSVVSGGLRLGMGFRLTMD